MYSLLIDTHAKIIRLALFCDKKLIDDFVSDGKMSHSQILVPSIINFLMRNNILKDDIKELIVVNGPGSFTGIRIGVTVAKTWAFTKKINIKTITSLELLKFSKNNRNNNIFAISDGKGYYVLENENIKYLNNSVFNYDNYLLENNDEIDYNQLYLYIDSLKNINPHLVNPLYIKKIGVEND